jgi:threonine dehydratase
MVTLTDIQNAHVRIAPYIRRTPLLRVSALDAICGCQVYLKPESLQTTGSFKLRGATNKLLSLNAEERARGIIAASSGNHGQGVAYAAQQLGIDAIIVMPHDAPPAKMEGVRSYGAKIEIYSGNLGSERDALMAKLAEEQGRVPVHPFSDPLIVAGQGTAALEVLADEPEVDFLIAPIGGGGLIGGLATAAKGLKPNLHLVGIEPAAAARYQASRAKGEATGINLGFTIADGTRTDQASAHNFPLIEQFVDDLYSITDDYIKQALYLYARYAKLVAEPSGALTLAAMLSGQIACKPTDKVCLVISGGNLDVDNYGVWLEEGKELYNVC